MLLKSLLAFGTVAVSSVLARLEHKDSTCTLYPEGDGKDDTDDILKAFDKCRTNSKILFTDNEFSIQKVMNTSNLENVDVMLEGRLKWSDDFDYWKNHTYNMWYQNQTTAWVIGGENITFMGKSVIDHGVFDGNGQAWYTQNKGEANQKGRPIAFTIWNAKNFHGEHLSFMQPQFWAVFVTHSQNVTLRDVHVKATTNDLENASLINTDGADTWNSRDVLFEDWQVENGDDCVAPKGNSTNIVVRNVNCYNHSVGFAIGSMGQYKDYPDYIDDIVFENCELHNSNTAGYIKAWPGVYQQTSTNGDFGGGGDGHARNLTFRNMYLANVEMPISITPCIYLKEGHESDCEKSKVKIDGVTWENLQGTSRFNLVSQIRCPDDNHCKNVHMKNINVVSTNMSVGLPNSGVNHSDMVYACGLIDNQNTTLGGQCNRWAPMDRILMQTKVKNYN